MRDRDETPRPRESTAPDVERAKRDETVRRTPRRRRFVSVGCAVLAQRPRRKPGSAVLTQLSQRKPGCAVLAQPRDGAVGCAVRSLATLRLAALAPCGSPRDEVLSGVVERGRACATETKRRALAKAPPRTLSERSETKRGAPQGHRVSSRSPPASSLNDPRGNPAAPSSLNLGMGRSAHRPIPERHSTRGVAPCGSLRDEGYSTTRRRGVDPFSRGRAPTGRSRSPRASRTR